MKYCMIDIVRAKQNEQMRKKWRTTEIAIQEAFSPPDILSLKSKKLNAK